MKTHFSEEDKYLRAKQRVKELRGFYIHLVIYLVINSFLTLNKVISVKFEENIPYTDAFLNFNSFSVWIFWGIGLAFHAFNVFGFNYIFGKNWEQRKIQEFMEEDQEQFKSMNR